MVLYETVLDFCRLFRCCPLVPTFRILKSLFRNHKLIPPFFFRRANSVLNARAKEEEEENDMKTEEAKEAQVIVECLAFIANRHYDIEKKTFPSH